MGSSGLTPPYLGLGCCHHILVRCFRSDPCLSRLRVLHRGAYLVRRQPFLASAHLPPPILALRVSFISFLPLLAWPLLVPRHSWPGGLVPCVRARAGAFACLCSRFCVFGEYLIRAAVSPGEGGGGGCKAPEQSATDDMACGHQGKVVRWFMQCR